MNSILKKAFSLVLVLCFVFLGIGFVNVTASEVTYTMTIDSSKNGTNDVHWLNSETTSITYNEVTWNTSITGTTSITTSTTQIQIGSKNSPATNVTLSTTGFAGKTIKSASLTGFCMSNTGPTLSITAGSTTILSNQALVKTNSTEYSSTNTTNVIMGNSDVLTFTITSSAKAAIVISEISVVYVVDDVNVESISLNKNSTSILVDDSETLTATILPNNATNKNINWTSSDETIASVDENGVVTGIKAGTVTITATSAENGEITATCNVTVTATTAEVESISLNKSESTLEVGESETLVSTINPSNASKELEWSSSDSSIATVDSTGKVTALKPGSVNITATSSTDSSKYATCTFTTTMYNTYDHIDSFTSVNGSFENKSITYSCSKEDASTAPAINSNHIRLYQCATDKNASYINIKSSNYVSINKIILTSAATYDTTICYSIDNEENSTDYELKKSTAFEIGDINATSIKIYCRGTTSSARLDIAKLEVYYTKTNIDTRIISFNENGGTGIMSDQITTNGVASTLSTNAFIKTGHSFSGWNTKEDGTGTSYSDEQSITTLTGNLQLYAQWTIVETSTTITFNSNTSSEEEYNQIVEKDVPTNLSVNTFVNSGMIFNGWNTEEDGTGTSYDDKASITTSNPITLYAQWKDYDLSQISSVTNDGSYYRIKGEIVGCKSYKNYYIQDSTGALLIYSSTTLTVGNEITVTCAYDSKYNNYSNCTNIVVTDSTDKTINTASLDESAIISSNKYKYVEASNLYIQEVNGTTFTIKDKTYKLYFKEEAYCTNYGDLLVGNYVDVKGVVEENNSEVVILVTEVTKLTTYTITYVTNGGSGVASEIVLNNTLFTKPSDPTKASDSTYNYSFASWYTDNETFNNKYNFDTPATSDITVYAKWTPSKIVGTQSEINAITSRMSLAFTYDTNHSYTEKFVRITDASEISDGAQVLIVGKKDGAYYLCSNSPSNSTCSATSFAISNDEIINSDSLNSYIWNIAFSASSYKLNNGSGFLTCDDASLSISETGTLFSIYNDATNSYFCDDTRLILLRNENNVFKNYSNKSFTSTYADNMYIFVKKNIDNPSYENVDFRFKCVVENLFDEIEGVTEYGIKVSQGTTEKLYSSSNEYYYGGDEVSEHYVIIKLGDCLNNTSRLTAEFTVTAYVKTSEGTYYSSEATTYSIQSILEEMVNDTSITDETQKTAISKAYALVQALTE